jgi:hypothetical protein
MRAILSECQVAIARLRLYYDVQLDPRRMRLEALTMRALGRE